MGVNFGLVRVLDEQPAVAGDGNAFLSTEKLIDLLGGKFPSAPRNSEAELLETVQMDGYTREKHRIRLMDDETAMQEHPELAGTGLLLRAFDVVDDSDTENLAKLYDHLLPLNESAAYGGAPLSPLELKNPEEAIKKYPPAEARQWLADYHRQAMEFYTHTEMYVLIPRDIKPGEKRPGIVATHQHNGDYANGQSELVGLAGDLKNNQATALDLVRQGHIVVTYDALGFGSRRHPCRQPLEPEIFWETDADGNEIGRKTGRQVLGKAGGLQWERQRSNGLEQIGQTLNRFYINDAMRIVDYAASRADVDPEKIGAYGHSLGSWVTASLAAVDSRIKVAVCNAGFPSIMGMNVFPAQYHCEPHSIPGIHAYGGFPAMFHGREGLRLHMNVPGTDVLNLSPADPRRMSVRDLFNTKSHGTIDQLEAIFATKDNSAFTSYISPYQIHANDSGMLSHTLTVFAGGFAELDRKKAEPKMEGRPRLEDKGLMR